MMIRPGIVVAAAVVLTADGWLLWSAARNRSGSPTAVIELTERELRLVRSNQDSTALLLRIVSHIHPVFHRDTGDGPAWFDKAKLEQVGFDCRRPPDNPASAVWYNSMPAREVFVALEYNSATEAGSGLSALDVGLDPAPLRARYSDTKRFLITRGLARVTWRKGTLLRGRVTELQVSQVNVPLPQRAVLDGLEPVTNDYDYRRNPSVAWSPRFSVTLHYGRNFEPFVASCRLLPPNQQ